MVTRCQESDILTDFYSDLSLILGQKSFNHVELQVIISVHCFGMIPALGLVGCSVLILK